MYIGPVRLCVCTSVSRHIPALLHLPDVTWGNGGGCLRLGVHCWADLQSVNGFHCYDNIAPNAKCQRVLVLALCLVYDLDTKQIHFLSTCTRFFIGQSHNILNSFDRRFTGEPALASPALLFSSASYDRYFWG